MVCDIRVQMAILYFFLLPYLFMLNIGIYIGQVRVYQIMMVLHFTGLIIVMMRIMNFLEVVNMTVVALECQFVPWLRNNL